MRSHRTHLQSQFRPFRLLGYVLPLFFMLLSGYAAKTNAAIAVSQARDCDANAVLLCGALTTQELTMKYMDAQDGSGRFILNAHGISDQDITELEAKAVTGRVTKGGQVFVGEELVATNAMTAGRQNMPGSTSANANGVTYYKRPPSVSFRSNSLDAFVVMDNNNQFKYAVLTSCGNPVTAVAVAPLPPPPAPAPVTPSEAPPKLEAPPPIVVITKQELPPAPTPAPAPIKQLPDTGPGNILALSGVASITGALGHNVFLRRRLNK